MIRLKVLKKTTVLVFLLVLTSSPLVAAQTKVYQYDGKLPFVQMMLNMMVAMGILDRLPSNGRYGNYGAFGNSTSPWSRYANNPFSRSPWSQSPWSPSTAGAVSPIWGSPDWGVLPVESYSYNNYAPYGSRWSSANLDGWVNEPWEVSEWNPDIESKKQSRTEQPSQSQLAPKQAQAVQPVAPIVQNFNYNVAESARKNDSQHGNRYASKQKGNSQENRRNNSRQGSNKPNRQSPLAKLQRPEQQGWQGRGAGDSRAMNQTSPRHKTKPQSSQSRYRKQKPCVSEFCGLKKPDLNGLWVSPDGEMLGIKNKHYLWTDGNSRYLTGQLKVQNEYLLANIDGHDKLMRFKYKLAGNHLLTLQPDGKVREFVRTPNNQYADQYYGQQYGQNSGQYPGYGQGYGQGQGYNRGVGQGYGPNYDAYSR